MENWKNEMPEYLNRVQKDEDYVMKIILKIIGLFLIITAGVTCGNLMSNAITAKVAAHELRKATAKMGTELEAQNELRLEKLEQWKFLNARKREELRKKAAEEKAKEKIKSQAEQRRRANMTDVERQRDDTCNFWISEYRKDKSEFSQSHRDVACRDAGRPFRK